MGRYNKTSNNEGVIEKLFQRLERRAESILGLINKQLVETIWDADINDALDLIVTMVNEIRSDLYQLNELQQGDERGLEEYSQITRRHRRYIAIASRVSLLLQSGFNLVDDLIDKRDDLAEYLRQEFSERIAILKAFLDNLLDHLMRAMRGFGRAVVDLLSLLLTPDELALSGVFVFTPGGIGAELGLTLTYRQNRQRQQSSQVKRRK